MGTPAPFTGVSAGGGGRLLGRRAQRGPSTLARLQPGPFLPFFYPLFTAPVAGEPQPCWTSTCSEKVSADRGLAGALQAPRSPPACSENSHTAISPPIDKGGDPELVRESQRRRFADVGLVDKVLEYDLEWRQGEAIGAGARGCRGRELGSDLCPGRRAPAPSAARWAMEQAKKEFNAINKKIAELKKVQCGQSRRSALHAARCALLLAAYAAAATRAAAATPLPTLRPCRGHAPPNCVSKQAARACAWHGRTPPSPLGRSVLPCARHA
jgi:hypothetical protein